MKGGFFPLISRMKYVNRWSLMRNTQEENLMEHSFETAAIAQALAIIGKKVYNKSVSAERVASAALYHDCSEIITGDMPTPIKYGNPSLREAYKEVELSAKERLCSLVPDIFREEYEELLCFEEKYPEEYKYIKAADKISAYLKCIAEEQGGNRDFVSAKNQLKQSIEDMHMEEADYFMENFLHLYGKTLDELTV
ncbi:MAG: 5'-deoxynucleotidase [Clostridia bacterium]|nr:5'-deoxynucleotidase [Clostridia bacterium]